MPFLMGGSSLLHTIPCNRNTISTLGVPSSSILASFHTFGRFIAIGVHSRCNVSFYTYMYSVINHGHRGSIALPDWRVPIVRLCPLYPSYVGLWCRAYSLRMIASNISLSVLCLVLTSLFFVVILIHTVPIVVLHYVRRGGCLTNCRLYMWFLDIMSIISSRL
jgi:hypothetical protein